ncbi:hypothetical protein M3202_21510 [Alkalihalobacillus oceani]|uniref:Uncharacterized protein n=1 Tax=Halalkalibacter oceani TaxID=1653776 RepID=A0A9X2DWN5_9BACI|nr:hypothetical protein [Halalkalibacter oceani]MCM3716623.1 hypothetical protein [Halalkalibacter oceani]
MKTLLQVMLILMCMCFMVTYVAAEDVSEPSVTERIANATPESPAGDVIDYETIKSNADSYTFGTFLSKAKDLSFQLLIAWLILAGFILFFSLKIAFRLAVIGVGGFFLIQYHEEALTVVFAVGNWLADFLRVGFI